MTHQRRKWSAGVVLGMMVFFLFPLQGTAQAQARPPGCLPGEVYCTPDVQVDMGEDKSCLDMLGKTIFGTTCTSYGEATNITAYDSALEVMFEQFTRATQTLAVSMATFILVDELGSGANMSNPILDCKLTQEANPAETKGTPQNDECEGKTPWFLGQYTLMRQVGVYLVVPMFFLMVIQAVARGSLHMLLKGALIMLPVAVLGTVVIVTLMQMLLNISDDMTRYIVFKTTEGTGSDCPNSLGVTVKSPSCNFTKSIIEESIGSAGMLWSTLWLLLFIFGAGVIWLEVISRQLGVYMMTLLMPLGFAGLVWPRAVSIAKKLLQYEIALIFSKVFIAAAISLGMAAIANTGSTDSNAAPPAPGEISSVGNNNGPNQAIMVGALVVLMAMYAGVKIVTISPAAGAAANRMMTPYTAFTRGQVLALVQARLLQQMNRRNARKDAGDDFDPNKAKGGKDGAAGKPNGGNGNDPLPVKGGPPDGPKDSDTKKPDPAPGPPPTTDPDPGKSPEQHEQNARDLDDGAANLEANADRAEANGDHRAAATWRRTADSQRKRAGEERTKAKKKRAAPPPPKTPPRTPPRNPAGTPGSGQPAAGKVTPRVVDLSSGGSSQEHTVSGKSRFQGPPPRQGPAQPGIPGGPVQPRIPGGPARHYRIGKKDGVDTPHRGK